MCDVWEDSQSSPQRSGCVNYLIHQGGLQTEPTVQVQKTTFSFQTDISFSLVLDELSALIHPKTFFSPSTNNMAVNKIHRPTALGQVLDTTNIIYPS